MNLIWRIKQCLKNDYYCDCHNPNHRPKQSLLGLAGAYVGMAISLGVTDEC